VSVCVCTEKHWEATNTSRSGNQREGIAAGMSNLARDWQASVQEGRKPYWRVSTMTSLSAYSEMEEAYSYHLFSSLRPIEFLSARLCQAMIPCQRVRKKDVKWHRTTWNLAIAFLQAQRTRPSMWRTSVRPWNCYKCVGSQIYRSYIDWQRRFASFNWDVSGSLLLRDFAFLTVPLPILWNNMELSLCYGSVRLCRVCAHRIEDNFNRLKTHVYMHIDIHAHPEAGKRKFNRYMIYGYLAWSRCRACQRHMVPQLLSDSSRFRHCPYIGVPHADNQSTSSTSQDIPSF
jgi:hypothetical protein